MVFDDGGVAAVARAGTRISFSTGMLMGSAAGGAARLPSSAAATSTTVAGAPVGGPLKAATANSLPPTTQGTYGPAATLLVSPTGAATASMTTANAVIKGRMTSSSAAAPAVAAPVMAARLFESDPLAETKHTTMTVAGAASGSVPTSGADHLIDL
jgi:hypothetical protein